ncbi:SAM-dependent methyltransferase [Neorhizobium sp. SOG26]|uniref:N-6 DNA methylase n=1 Tax=Neorhizobium sp. SOG26 TaxID=2060726 RepID=UPI000E570205|nr:N-6 DNA methylase [Neorhizobium sp. SOG26]AXV15084.1 SAM-dependent methyltransferase [Neorhizobium sp. SOG26]
MPQIAQDVLKVLDAATIDGALLTLNGNLDRKLYVETNKVLEAAGGKWNRSKKAHVFEGNAIDAIEPIILTGEYRVTKQDFGQFDTPEGLATEVAIIAGIEAGMQVLEPNIGIGRIAFAAERRGGIITGFEIDLSRAAKAHAILPKANIKVADFLAEEPEARFDRVVMNPPFAKQDDIRHVLHAFKFLRPGGKLVAIMSNSVMFRDNKMTTDFRAFVEAHSGTMKALPEGSFKSSGTGVNTCIVTLIA